MRYVLAIISFLPAAGWYAFGGEDLPGGAPAGMNWEKILFMYGPMPAWIIWHLHRQTVHDKERKAWDDERKEIGKVLLEVKEVNAGLTSSLEKMALALERAEKELRRVTEITMLNTEAMRASKQDTRIFTRKDE